MLQIRLTAQGKPRGKGHGVRVGSAAPAAGGKLGQVEARSQRPLVIPQDMTATKEFKPGATGSDSCLVVRQAPTAGEQTRRDMGAG